VVSRIWGTRKRHAGCNKLAMTVGHRTDNWHKQQNFNVLPAYIANTTRNRLCHQHKQYSIRPHILAMVRATALWPIQSKYRGPAYAPVFVWHTEASRRMEHIEPWRGKLRPDWLTDWLTGQRASDGIGRSTIRLVRTFAPPDTCPASRTTITDILFPRLGLRVRVRVRSGGKMSGEEKYPTLSERPPCTTTLFAARPKDTSFTTQLARPLAGCWGYIRLYVNGDVPGCTVAAAAVFTQRRKCRSRHLYSSSR